MTTIRFKLERTIISARVDASWLDGDPIESLTHAVIQSISTDLDVTAGGVTLHLAAWMDPEHWDADWQAKGISDGREFIAGLARSEAAS